MHEVDMCVSAVAMRPANDGHLASVSSDVSDEPTGGQPGSGGLPGAATSPAQEEPSTSSAQIQQQQEKPQG